jgi:hypothetical protein
MGSLEQFGKILEKVDKSQTSSDFWNNEKKSFEELERKTNELKEKLTMSSAKYHQCFSM